MLPLIPCTVGYPWCYFLIIDGPCTNSFYFIKCFYLLVTHYKTYCYILYFTIYLLLYRWLHFCGSYPFFPTHWGQSLGANVSHWISTYVWVYPPQLSGLMFSLVGPQPSTPAPSLIGISVSSPGK